MGDDGVLVHSTRTRVLAEGAAGTRYRELLQPGPDNQSPHHGLWRRITKGETMAYYSVLAVTPTNEDWIADYIEPANTLVAQHGGKYLARTSSHERL